MLLCPPVGDAGANQLHRKSRRTRWDRQNAEFRLLLRSRSCNDCFDPVEIHTRKDSKSLNRDSAIKKMFVRMDHRPQQYACGSGVFEYRLIDLNPVASLYKHIDCGKAVRNNSQSATHSVRACPTTQPRKPGTRSIRSHGHFFCFIKGLSHSRYESAPAVPPIQALLKVRGLCICYGEF